MLPGQPRQGKRLPRGCGGRRASSLPGLSGLALPLRHPLRKPDKQTALVPLPAATPAAAPGRQGRQPPDAAGEAAALRAARNPRPPRRLRCRSPCAKPGSAASPQPSPTAEVPGRGAPGTRSARRTSPPAAAAAARPPALPPLPPAAPLPVAGMLVATRHVMAAAPSRQETPLPQGLPARPRLSLAAPSGAERGGAPERGGAGPATTLPLFLRHDAAPRLSGDGAEAAPLPRRAERRSRGAAAGGGGPWRRWAPPRARR